jgi:FtsZ-interacting cell division protein ZipA
MKRVIIGLTAALALVFMGTARADDTKSSESKSKTTEKSEATKEASPSTTQDTGMGGSGTATKSEKKTTEKKETKTDDAAKTAPPAK